MDENSFARALLYKERQQIVIWKKPFQTIYYFLFELFWLFIDGLKVLLNHKITVLAILVSTVLSIYLYHIPGDHQRYIETMEKKFFWCLYWFGLGFLSSMGSGHGRDTFVLYLAPHIAKVTVAAYECGSLNFPEPPYPQNVTCPNTQTFDGGDAITLWSIISKIRVESWMWGIGTVMEELPLYFIAQWARKRSNADEKDEDYLNFLALQTEIKELTFMEKFKQKTENFIKKFGFLKAIFVFLLIPNSFFGFASILNGYFLMPFWAFFGATLIGKLFRMAPPRLYYTCWNVACCKSRVYKIKKISKNNNKSNFRTRPQFSIVQISLHKKNEKKVFFSTKNVTKLLKLNLICIVILIFH